MENTCACLLGSGPESQYSHQYTALIIVVTVGTVLTIVVVFLAVTMLRSKYKRVERVEHVEPRTSIQEALLASENMSSDGDVPIALPASMQPMQTEVPIPPPPPVPRSPTSRVQTRELKMRDVLRLIL